MRRVEETTASAGDPSGRGEAPRAAGRTEARNDPAAAFRACRLKLARAIVFGSVLAVTLAQQGGSEATFEAQLSGGLRNPADLVQAGILRPLNLKFGKQCLNVITSAADELTIAFEPGCNDPAVLARVETLPPAALLDAPQTRREAVVKNPETLKKLTI